MLKTLLTAGWGLRYPIIGAPMAYVGRGRLARAISQAGGLGMIGFGSKDGPEFIQAETAAARGNDESPFGIGLMAWALEARPELLEAALEARPFLISVSFGSPAPFAKKIHRQGIKLAVQVHSREEALEAAGVGADLLVAQGTEAGGHTAQVASLPLLQIVLEAVKIPVVAAGGIGTARGVAAVLAAGAEGAWIGTRFLASPECDNSETARQLVIQTPETETVLTRAFDVTQGLAWPSQFPGRALRNRFSDQWHSRVEAIPESEEARRQLTAAIAARDYSIAYIYAGQSVGLVNRSEPAGEIVRQLGEGAEELLRQRSRSLLSGED